MLRSLSSLKNLLTCFWSLNPWKYLINNRVRLLHICCNCLRFIFIILSVLFKYLIKKFPWTFSKRFHNFIFFCSAFFIICFILVHNFWSNRSLLINLISLSLFLLISNSFEKFKYTSKVFLFNNFINIGIFIPLINMTKRRIKWLRIIVFHYNVWFNFIYYLLDYI